MILCDPDFTFHAVKKKKKRTHSIGEECDQKTNSLTLKLDLNQRIIIEYYCLLVVDGVSRTR